VVKGSTPLSRTVKEFVFIKMNRLNQQIYKYVKSHMEGGLDRDKIKNSLIISGYSEVEIDEVFNYIDEALKEYSGSKNTKKNLKPIKILIFIGLILIVGLTYLFLTK